MNNTLERLKAIALQTNRPEEEIITKYLLQAVLRRVGRSTYVNELILRGGMLTTLWIPIGKRIAQDVDFLALYPFSIEATQEKLTQALSITGINDEVEFNQESLTILAIWQETEFPGARVKIEVALGDLKRNIQIDVGFGDPLAFPPQWLEYPTLLQEETIKLLAVCPEIMLAWKLHGMVEQGSRNWRGKDLYDVMLLTTEVNLDEAKLKKAIPLAFNSRNTPIEKLVNTLSLGPWWHNHGNRGKWKRYQREMPTQIMPEDVTIVANIVINRWKPFLETLITPVYTPSSISSL